MQAEISYIPCGDYFVPNLRLDGDFRPIGRWGRLRRDYLKKHRPGFYAHLLLSGALWPHLADVDEQAHEQIDSLIERLKAGEGVTEELKDSDPLEWVRRMNNLSARAEEIVREDLIFV